MDERTGNPPNMHLPYIFRAAKAQEEMRLEPVDIPLLRTQILREYNAQPLSMRHFGIIIGSLDG